MDAGREYAKDYGRDRDYPKDPESEYMWERRRERDTYQESILRISISAENFSIFVPKI
jgi:hypothetical protein